MDKKPKPIFNKRIFRDVVFENTDYDAKARFRIKAADENPCIEGFFIGRRHGTVTLLWSQEIC